MQPQQIVKNTYAGSYYIDHAIELYKGQFNLDS